MALKFLNKKGWHTGSLRNIENVWKAEQKHDAEQKKLEELKKQIQEERERNEFIQLQEQAGLVPRQEKLGFLYDSGLSVGKPSSSKDGGSGVAFKALEEAAPGKPASGDGASASDKQQAAVPGALFEDKPHSANDAWRKLHSDPLLMIRQREQEALARIKNNPVQMAMIRKSVEKKEEKGKDQDKHRKKHKHGKIKHHKHSSNEQSDSETDGEEYRVRRVGGGKDSERHRHRSKAQETSGDESCGRERLTRGDNNNKSSKYRERSPARRHDDSQDFSMNHHGSRDSDFYPKERRDRTSYHGKSHDSSAVEDRSDESRGRERRTRADDSKSSKYREKSPAGTRDDSQDVCRNHRGSRDSDVHPKERGDRTSYHGKSRDSSAIEDRSDSRYKRRNVAPKLSEEERAARLREMQADAEVHEEQRWKRLKRAEEDDALEATRASQIKGKNFLEATHKSVYGTEKGGSSTIEESIRRRTHYLQGRSQGGDGNAFRR